MVLKYVVLTFSWGIHSYFYAINGTSIISSFKASTVVSFEGDQYLVEINKAAIFTNFSRIKRKLEEIPTGSNILID